jgi:hypothetical protein
MNETQSLMNAKFPTTTSAIFFATSSNTLNNPA